MKSREPRDFMDAATFNSVMLLILVVATTIAALVEVLT